MGVGPNSVTVSIGQDQSSPGVLQKCGVSSRLFITIALVAAAAHRAMTETWKVKDFIVVRLGRQECLKRRGARCGRYRGGPVY